MLYVLYGPDDYSRDQALRQLQARMGDPQMASLNTTRLEANGLTTGALLAAASAMPFLAEHRLVVAIGLLGRFNPRRGSGGESAAPSAGSKGGGPQAWAEALGQVPDFTWLVLLDGEVDRSNPLLRALPAGSQVRVFEKLRGDALQEWIGRQARERGGSLEDEAAAALANAVDDLRVLASEIEKLVLYADGSPVNAQHVRDLVGYARESDVFALVDAVLQRRATQAARQLHQLLERGEAPAYVLFMLARQFRQVLLCRDLVAARASEEEMRRTLGRLPDFVLRRLVQQARSYSLTELEAAYFRLVEADLASKTGRTDPALALERLLVDLCQRSNSEGRSGRGA